MATMLRDGGVGLDVVDGVEDEAAVRREDLATLQDLAPDLLRRAEGQRLLRVHAAAPEDEPVAVALLERRRVHARGRALHRVEDVEARVDEVRDERLHRAAGVLERLPGRVSGGSSR